MKSLRALLLLVIPVAVAAHPGGGLIALNADTVIFGDPMNNVVWRLEKGSKPHALVKNFHAHWTTRGLDGHVYSESFQEIGGALFRIPLDGGKHVKVAEESHLEALVFAVGKRGEIIFQKAGQIMERSTDGAVRRFRGSGEVAKGEPPLQQVIAYHWATDETLYLSDGNSLRRVGRDGVVRLVARVDGKLLQPQIWNATGAPRIWSIAIDERKRIFTALPDLGQVVRLDPDGSQHVVDTSAGGWRVTAVATFGDSVFMLESSDSTNAGQRVRVLRGSGKVELLGQVAEPFSVTTETNFGTDHRTRISLFVEDLRVHQTFPTIVVNAVDVQQNQYQLPLEVVAFYSVFPFQATDRPATGESQHEPAVRHSHCQR